MLLFASSNTELQLLLHQCQLELAWLDLCINEKSCYVRIGNRFDIDCANITSLDGTSLPWVRKPRYLGVFLISDCKFKCSLHHADRAFYRAANAISGKVAIERHRKKLYYILLKVNAIQSYCMGLRHARYVRPI